MPIIFRVLLAKKFLLIFRTFDMPEKMYCTCIPKTPVRKTRPVLLNKGLSFKNST